MLAKLLKEVYSFCDIDNSLDYCQKRITHHKKEMQENPHYFCEVLVDTLGYSDTLMMYLTGLGLEMPYNIFTEVIKFIRDMKKIRPEMEEITE